MSGLKNRVEGMSGKRILLVDDEPVVGQCVQIFLELDRHETEFVHNPLEALAKYQPGKYDLVLTDNRMPEMTGVELAEKIKSLSREQRIMLLTGFPPSRPTPAIDLVMLKPFSGDALRRAVAELTTYAESVR